MLEARFLRRLMLLAATSLVACAAATPALESADVSGADRHAWAKCYGGFSPTGDPTRDIASLTRSCGSTGGMRAITPVRFATQKERDPVDRYTFYVPRADSCYRIFAVGGRGIQDLDLLLRGPDGEDVVADLTHDSHPVLPPDRPLCFDSPGLYLLEVSVFRGSGRYAVQVWGS